MVSSLNVSHLFKEDTMKELSNIVATIAQEVKEIAHQLAENPPLSLTEAEQLLRETTRDWERRLMQACYVHHATQPQKDTTCPIGGLLMHRQRLRDKWVVTLCGDV